MSLWTDRVVPHLADASLRTPEVVELRAHVCPGPYGKELEIGFGIWTLEKIYAPGLRVSRPWSCVYFGVARAPR